jgi:hypothetical protein
MLALRGQHFHGESMPSIKPIQTLERHSVFDDEQTFIRIMAFDDVTDDGSISRSPLPSLRRRSYFDDGVNTHLRTVGINFNDLLFTVLGEPIINNDGNIVQK